jgi:hypothetical protein
VLLALLKVLSSPALNRKALETLAGSIAFDRDPDSGNNGREYHGSDAGNFSVWRQHRDPN